MLKNCNNLLLFHPQPYYDIMLTLYMHHNRTSTTSVYQQLNIMVWLTVVIFHQKVGCYDIRGKQSPSPVAYKKTLKSLLFNVQSH